MVEIGNSIWKGWKIEKGLQFKSLFSIEIKTSSSSKNDSSDSKYCISVALATIMASIYCISEPSIPMSHPIRLQSVLTPIPQIIPKEAPCR